MRKIVKQMNIFVIILMLVSLSLGCGGSNGEPVNEIEGVVEDVADDFEIDEEYDETEDDTTWEISDQAESSAYYQGNVKSIAYRENDQLISVFDYSGEQIFIDLDGNIVDNPQLKSQYLECDTGIGADGLVYDVNGADVTDRFVKDSKHERIVGLCNMDGKNVIWVRENNETPEHSQIIIKAIDEDGNEICRTDSDNSYFNESQAESFQYIGSGNVVYAGDSICKILERNRTGLFSINVETGELLDPVDGFFDGYAVISGEGILDVHGNYLVQRDDNDEIPEMLKNTFPYSEGLFFSQNTKKFYDINLNEKIDLSEYVLYYGEWSKSYVFEDGYCGIDVQNDAGTVFHGVIDRNGNWVIDLEDDFSGEYKGKISENKIFFGEKIYNLDTNEFEEYPWGMWGNNVGVSAKVDGKMYYVNDGGEIWVYDFETCENVML